MLWEWTCEPAACTGFIQAAYSGPEAVAFGVVVPDRVFVYQHHSDDPHRHFGVGPWVSKDSYIYEVEPIGTLEDDPGLGADPDNFKCCLKATVRRCIHIPESAL